MPIKEFFVLLMVCTAWGLHFVVMKFTVQNNADPLFYAACRATIVMLLMLPFLKWHRGQMRAVLLGGLGYGALNYAFMFPAMKMTTASAAAVTIELYMPFAILLSVIFLSERIGGWRLLGMTLAFMGVVIIGLSKPSEAAGPFYHLGIVFMACAAMSEAIGAIIVKKVEGIGPLQLLAWFAVIGTIVLWPLSLLTEQDQLRAITSPDTRWPFLAALTYSTLLVSIVAHASYYWLLQRLPIHTVAPSGLIMVLIGVIGSVLILKEPLVEGFIIGGLMTLGGVAIILWRNRARAKPTAHDLHPEGPMP
ncbi:DMT family transporter [Litorimonas sp. RW-G-Af-16]|uniref:DMT family transporter n=1 Tax=Litorimonas sp. RW-G-Af-16 TaxID=3241168 RepID=UPI00390C87F0